MAVAKKMTKAEETHYWIGRYDGFNLLLTSPRFNKSQVELIELQAFKAMRQLETLGMSFSPAGVEPTPAYKRYLEWRIDVAAEEKAS